MTQLQQSQRTQREDALLRALGQALKTVEAVDLNESLRIVDRLIEDVAPLDGPDLNLNCSDHIYLFPPLVGTLGELGEKLTDFFVRQCHEPPVARERADAVLEVIRQHLEVNA